MSKNGHKQTLPMNTCLRFGIVFVIAAGFVAGGTWITRELAKDGCLDREGAWN